MDGVPDEGAETPTGKVRSTAGAGLEAALAVEPVEPVVRCRPDGRVTVRIQRAAVCEPAVPGIGNMPYLR
jgi:hypothetical protein